MSDSTVRCPQCDHAWAFHARAHVGAGENGCVAVVRVNEVGDSIRPCGCEWRRPGDTPSRLLTVQLGLVQAQLAVLTQQVARLAALVEGRGLR